MCRLSGLLLPALLVAVAVSFLTGSDAWGLVGGVLTAGAFALVGRVRGASPPSCALPSPPPNPSSAVGRDEVGDPA